MFLQYHFHCTVYVQKKRTYGVMILKLICKSTCFSDLLNGDMGQFVDNESLNMTTALFLIFALKLVSFGAVCAWMLFVKESL